jgi:hypothetical protein
LADVDVAEVGMTTHQKRNRPIASRFEEKSLEIGGELKRHVTDKDVEVGKAAKEHRLGRRKRRVFVQCVCEEMGCPPKFHHDGEECWDGKGGVIEATRLCLPFNMDKRTVVWICEMTWDAWFEKRLDDFDAGAAEEGHSVCKGSLSTD